MSLARSISRRAGIGETKLFSSLRKHRLFPLYMDKWGGNSVGLPGKSPIPTKDCAPPWRATPAQRPVWHLILQESANAGQREQHFLSYKPVFGHLPTRTGPPSAVRSRKAHEMQEQPISSSETRTWPAVSTGCTDDCAWGLAERGIQPQTGSHGICPYHQAQMLAQYHRTRSTRRAVPQQ